MPDYVSKKLEITELYSQGKSSIKIANTLSEKYNEDYSSRIIRKKISNWGLKNKFSEKLQDNGFVPTDNWAYGWLKTKEASVFVKNPQESFNVSDFKDELISGIRESMVGFDFKKPSTGHPASGNMFVPCIFDLHLGKLAWDMETGEDYDVYIASQRFENAISDLIAKSSGYNIDKILFPIGNDLFNSDKSYPFPTTTKGTPQADDTRWQKMFKMGVSLINNAILRLSQVAPVEVVTVFSNHDHERVFYLGEVVSATFDGSKYVTVDNSPSVRKYKQHGEVLIGLAHGHNEKAQDLPFIMAQEAKQMWADTFYREWLLGHLHHRQKFITQESKEYRGVKVTYLTSPSASDAWHYEKAFTGAIKGAEGFIYNQSEGLIGTVVHNIK